MSNSLSCNRPPRRASTKNIDFRRLADFKSDVHEIIGIKKTEANHCKICGKCVEHVSKNQNIDQSESSLLSRLFDKKLTVDSGTFLCLSCSEKITRLKNLEFEANQIKQSLLYLFAESTSDSGKCLKYLRNSSSRFPVCVFPLNIENGCFQCERQFPGVKASGDSVSVGFFVTSFEFDELLFSKPLDNPLQITDLELEKLDCEGEVLQDESVVIASRKVLTFLKTKSESLQCGHCLTKFSSAITFLSHRALSNHEIFLVQDVESSPGCVEARSNLPQPPKQSADCLEILSETEECRQFNDNAELEDLSVKVQDRGKPFCCSICGKGFTRKAYMIEHQARHSGRKERQCPICHKKFYNTSYWRHMATVHAKDDKLSHECEMCNRKFAQRFLLRLHMKSHQAYEERQFQCSKCFDSKRFPTLSRLRAHEKQVHDTKDLQVDEDSKLCSDCGEMFPSGTEYSTHSHQDDQDFAESLQLSSLIVEDHKTFSDEGSNFEIFTQSEPFELSSASNSGQLIQQNGCHPEELTMPSTSFVPTVQFFSLTPVEELKTKIGRGNYPCEFCDRIFSSSKTRSQHKLSMHTHDKNYICKICQTILPTKSDLKTHSKTHATEKPYKCFTCGKDFRMSKDLKRHIRVHTGEKPYKCNDCDKRFSSSSNLSEHRTIHTGKMNYECPNCNRRFRLWSTLKKHRLRCLPKEPEPTATSLVMMNEASLQSDQAIMMEALESESAVYIFDSQNDFL